MRNRLEVDTESAQEELDRKYCELDSMEDMNPLALPKKVKDEIWASVLKGETCPFEDDRGMYIPVQREDGVPWEKFRLDSDKFKMLMEGTLNVMSDDLKKKLKEKKK